MARKPLLVKISTGKQDADGASTRQSRFEADMSSKEGFCFRYNLSPINAIFGRHLCSLVSQDTAELYPRLNSLRLWLFVAPSATT
jgi:hypothetical protein